MRGFIHPSGFYYESAELIGGLFDENGVQIGGPVEVPIRPGIDYVFTAGAWVAKTLSLADVQAREVAQTEAAADARLDRIDTAVRRAVVKLAEGVAVPAPLLARIKKNDLIEDARDAAIIAINAAANKPAARAVFPAIVWP